MVLLMMAITAAAVGMKLVIDEDCWLRFYYFQCWFVVRC